MPKKTLFNCLKMHISCPSPPMTLRRQKREAQGLKRFNQAEEWRRSIEWCHKFNCDTSSDCRVIANQNELCVATYQADLAPSLLVLNAQ